MYKIEVQNENGEWRDVRDANGKILTFQENNEARAKLQELYPVETQMEKYVGPKKTRVISMEYDDPEEAND